MKRHRVWGGGAALESSATGRRQILQGSLKRYTKGIALYPEGTREPPKGFKQGEDTIDLGRKF